MFLTIPPAAREYESFGNVIPNSATGTWPGRFGYQGQSWQEIVSNNGSQRLLLSPTRLYDPVTGRFIQNEPLFRRRPSSHYLYGNQNPVGMVDPLGLEGCTILPTLPDCTGLEATTFEDGPTIGTQIIVPSPLTGSDSLLTNTDPFTDVASGENTFDPSSLSQYVSPIGLQDPHLGVSPPSPYGPATHEDIIRQAFPNEQEWVLQTIIQASAFTDRPANQAPELSYQHAMSWVMPFVNPKDRPKIAEYLSKQFIDFQMANAVSEFCAGEPEHAFWELGQGMHTLMDSTSPSHRGYQEWHGEDTPLHLIEAGAHVLGEWPWVGLNPMTKEINEAIEKIQDYAKTFVQKIGQTCPDVLNRIMGQEKGCSSH